VYRNSLAYGILITATNCHEGDVSGVDCTFLVYFVALKLTPATRYCEDRSGKYVSICSNTQAALKDLQAAKTTSPLERACQKALNDTFSHHTVGLFWVAGHSRVQGNETANKLTRNGTVQKFVGPEPALGVPRQNIRRQIKFWRENQHMLMWLGLISTHRQA
jgi:hypothetical protein